MAISSKSEEQEAQAAVESSLEAMEEIEENLEEEDEASNETASDKSKKKSKSSKKANKPAPQMDLSTYQVNEDLVKESSSIKDNMELLEKRLEKMYEHKENVSHEVFLKVKGDYESQLDKVRESFEEKCQDLEEELERLYELKEEQQGFLSHHENILEEAKFRHMLEEFSDEDFKNEQKTQNKEIKKYATIIETIQGSIQKYEDILGRPYTPKEQMTEIAEEEDFEMEEEEIPPAELLRKTPPSAPIAPAAPAVSSTAQTLSGPRLEETPPMGIPVSDIFAESAAEASEESLEQNLNQEYNDFMEIEGDYFNEQEDSISIEPSSEAPSTIEPDESISDILKDIPFEESVEDSIPHVEEPTGDLAHSTARRVVPQEGTEASLLLIEGTLDEHEFILGDSTTMGRSPGNDIVLKESRISRQHANIRKTEEGYVIVDLKSSNGILVNDQKVEEALLQDGDEVQVGGFRFQFNIL